MPKISVIIPIYNVENYLSQCLDSFINQTFKDIEIICVDDGSQDTSVNIIKEYIKKDDRIILITQTNQGAGAARNNGLKNAKGDYLYFFDSDDYADNSLLEKMHNKITKTNSDICVCRNRIYNEKTKEIRHCHYRNDIKSLNGKEIFSWQDIPQSIFQLFNIPAYTKLYRAKFIRDNGIEFQQIKTCNDVYFNFITLALAKSITVVNEELLTYRDAQIGNLSANRHKYVRCALEAFEAIKNKLEKENIFKYLEKSFYKSAFASFTCEINNCKDKHERENLEKELFAFIPKKYQSKKIFKKIFSIGNSRDKQYKIITIFGFEIKYKRKCHKYEKKLKKWYKKKTKQNLNLVNPQTFNEKIQWLKLYDSTPIKTRLADKYLVRDWIKEKIGEEYLIPLLGVYDKFEEINFDNLPNQFVIKCNHGSGYNIIVKDKSKLDLINVKTKLDKWINENFAFKCGIELHYKNIQPKIIIEKYITNNGEALYDYKFWCFNGDVKYMQFRDDFSSNLKMVFYDMKWNKQPFYYDHPLYDKELDMPHNFEQMKKISQKLCQGFAFVCVDLYRLNDGTIYFGEMTFTRSSGIAKWCDEKINKYLGDLIQLPKQVYNLDNDNI